MVKAVRVVAIAAIRRAAGQLDVGDVRLQGPARRNVEGFIDAKRPSPHRKARRECSPAHSELLERQDDFLKFHRDISSAECLQGKPKEPRPATKSLQGRDSSLRVPRFHPD